MEGREFEAAVLLGGGIGDSEAMASKVSAATIPPMEWPMRIVWTEGSTVGEGVEAPTSRSITLS